MSIQQRPLTEETDDILNYSDAAIYFFPCLLPSHLVFKQGTLSEREGSVPQTSLLLLAMISHFFTENIIFLFYKTSYLNKEISSTQPFSKLVYPAPRV
jgi:hypothetical protein